MSTHTPTSRRAFFSRFRFRSRLDAFFHITERGSTIAREVRGGVVTFFTMSYILVLNPLILSAEHEGIAPLGTTEQIAAGTALVAGVMTILMGLVANYPMALAAGLGINAMVAYTLVGMNGMTYADAMGLIVIEGVIILVLVLTGFREAVFRAVPAHIKTAISVGIGLFIAFIGLKGTGLIVENSATYVSLGHVTAPTTLLSLFGLLFTAALMARNVHGSILIGIFVTTILAMVLGMTPAPQGLGDIVSTSLPHMGETFGQLDLAGAWNYGLVSIIFTFTVVELFDNMGTLIGLTTKAKMVKSDGHIENIDKALTTDAVGTMVSAVFGTSTVTSYIESAAGIAAGGRTGLTAIAAGVLFLAALLFTPLIGLVPAFATAPALILVGALLMSEVGKIDFNDFTNALPAFLTIIMMPLTSSIANGFAFGFISYTVMKLFAGQHKQISWIMYLVSIAFLINLALRS